MGDLDNMIQAGKRVLGFGDDVADALEKSSDAINKFGMGVGTKFVSGIARKVIEEDIRTGFAAINTGANFLLGILVFAIIILFWFMYLKIEQPDRACKNFTYFALAGVGIVSCMLLGVTTLKLSVSGFGDSLFGDDGSVYRPINAMSR